MSQFNVMLHLDAFSNRKAASNCHFHNALVCDFSSQVHLSFNYCNKVTLLCTPDAAYKSLLTRKQPASGFERAQKSHQLGNVVNLRPEPSRFAST